MDNLADKLGAECACGSPLHVLHTPQSSTHNAKDALEEAIVPQMVSNIFWGRCALIRGGLQCPFETSPSPQQSHVGLGQR